MDPDLQPPFPDRGLPPPVERLLVGLWQQREDLGAIADELLAIFRSQGLRPPQDEEDPA